MGTENKKLDMGAVRAKLQGQTGQGYWKGLEQLADDEQFTQWLDDEFPYRKSLPEVDRRSVLKLMGASMALAGLVGCRSLPQERVIPFTKDPEGRPAGTTLYYATAVPFGGYGFPVLAESHEGRPTKFEGNPDHPASGGASDIYTQAAILNMYDPDRIQEVSHQGLIDTWDNFFAEHRKLLDSLRGTRGAGIRILTGTVTSPSLIGMIQKFQAAFPQATWHQYEPVNRDNERAGTRMAFGEAVDPVYDFSKATTVVSLDGDFMAGNPHTVRYARDFASTRDLNGSVSRLYAVESTPTLTGAFADHRVPVSPIDVYAVASAIAAKLDVGSASGKLPEGVTDAWVSAAAADLQAGGLVYVGAHQSPEVHALAHAINAKVGAPVTYVAADPAHVASQTASMAELGKAMSGGAVQLLLVMDCNPAYSAPGDVKFAESMAKVLHSVYIGEAKNETSKLCHWVLPQAHFLEAWGDVKGIDGTAMIQQPLIEPLFAGKSQIELLATLIRDLRTGEQIVRDTWKARIPSQVAWEKVLHDGFVKGSASPAKAVNAAGAAIAPPAAKSGTYAVFVPDATVWDGSWANNGWLQELPKPLTKLVWDNAVHMSPKKAEELGVGFEELVDVTANGVTVRAPVFVQPGHPDNSVTLPMGYGRTDGGKVLIGCGFDFMKLRSTKAPDFTLVEIKKAGGKHPLATAQLHHSMEGRDIIREGTLATYRANPELKPEGLHEFEDVTMYNLTKEWAKTGYPQWGMTIDLNLCVGCNACVTACQAENNIPTVGKQEVSRGRELHWMRIDRYYKVREAGESRDINTGITPSSPNPMKWESPVQTGGNTNSDVLDAGRIETVFQPVTCMHCETAPCEPVCPVAATVHSHEGLNQMVYNRCVGTRYCSNNCPYKVRRFNYYNYQHGQSDVGSFKDYGNRNFQGDKDVPLLRLLQNPDVTVRSRGVMEKCTYCVQRINEARIVAKKEHRELKDGDVVTACQQACPTKAIVFGNVADPNSAVSKAKAEKRNYGTLTELNTRPRTTYLGKVRNPNPELENA